MLQRFQDLESISFSQCGNYLIVMNEGQALPIIEPLPKAYLQLSLPSLDEDSDPGPTGSTAVIRSSASALTTLQTSKPLIHPSLTLQTSSQITPNTSRGIHVSQSSSQISLQLWQSNNTNQQTRSETIELAGLPDIARRDNTNVAVHLPETRDEQIKLILNMAPQPWSGMEKLEKGRRWLREEISVL